MKKEEISIDNLNKKEDGLIFKEHREFFINFFQKRDDFLSSFAMAKIDKDELKDSFLLLNYLIESTSPYILKEDKDKDVDKKIKEIESIINVSTEHDNCYNKIKSLHREISLLQVKAEILPKPLLAYDNEKENFWRGEENKAMKEIKKAFYDIVLKY